MCNTPECGGYCRRMQRRANRGAEMFAICGVLVLVVIPHILGILTGIITTLVCVGALVVGISAGYVYVRYVLPARHARAAAIMAHAGRPLPGRAPGVAMTSPAQAPALPAGNDQHLHLHLPAGMPAEDVARLMGRDR